MRNKIALNLILFTLFASISFGQKHKSVLKAPKTWLTEIIPFPLSFAPSIPYKGYEDLRFAPNWSDSTHANFWTYMFVWYIEKDVPVTTENLTKYFNAYYNGLMRIDSRNETQFKDAPLNHTISKFEKTTTGFNGTMEVYDGFFTKQYMTLNIKVEETFCPKKNKQIIRCDVSRQNFDHPVWQLFTQVKLKVKCK